MYYVWLKGDEMKKLLILLVLLMGVGYASNNIYYTNTFCLNATVSRYELTKYNGTSNYSMGFLDTPCSGGCNNATGLCTTEAVFNYSWIMIIGIIAMIGGLSFTSYILSDQHAWLKLFLMYIPIFLLYYLWLVIGLVGENFTGPIQESSELMLGTAGIMIWIFIFVYVYFALVFIYNLFLSMQEKRKPKDEYI